MVLNLAIQAATLFQYWCLLLPQWTSDNICNVLLKYSAHGWVWKKWSINIAAIISVYWVSVYQGMEVWCLCSRCKMVQICDPLSVWIKLHIICGVFTKKLILVFRTASCCEIDLVTPDAKTKLNNQNFNLDSYNRNCVFELGRNFRFCQLSCKLKPFDEKN